MTSNPVKHVEPRWPTRLSMVVRRRASYVLVVAGASVVLGLLVVAGGPRTVPLAHAGTSALPEGRWETIASGNDVLCLQDDGNLLWAGTRAGGLVRWDTQTGAYLQFLRPQDPLGGNTVYDIAVDGDGRKWIATDGGLTVLDDKGTADLSDDKWRTFRRSDTFGGLPSDDVRAVAVDGDLVWVGAAQVYNPTSEGWEGGGVGRLDHKGTDATADDIWAPVATFEGTLREGPQGEKILGLVSDNITDLVLTGDGGLWVSTNPHWRYEKPPISELPPRWMRMHGGVSYLDTKGTPDTEDDDWTASDCEDYEFSITCSVQTLALDHSGRVWAAIGGRGIIYWPVAEVPVIDEPSRVFHMPEGARDDFVEGIGFGPADSPDMENVVWLARRKSGLSVLDHRGSIRNKSDDIWDLDFGEPLTSEYGLANDRAQSVVVDGSVAWIGTGSINGVSGGVSPFDIDDESFGTPLTTDNAPPTNFVTGIAPGVSGTRWEGHVWLATGSRVHRRFGVGAVDLNTNGTSWRGDDTFSNHTAANSDDDGEAPWTGLAGDNLHSLVIDGDNVWLGAANATWDQATLRFVDGGLSVYDGDRWTVRTVDNTGGSDMGLRHGSVSAIAVGCEGDVWVGTGNGWDFWGAGVDVLDYGGTLDDLGDDAWTGHSFPLLAGSNTNAIAPDCVRRQVWVSSEHHVTQGDPNTGQPGGDYVGGGVAMFDMATEVWSRQDADEGLECYSQSYIECEATEVEVDPGGELYVGTYGLTSMSKSVLVGLHPFTPAVVNRGSGREDDWNAEVFGFAGRISEIELDADGRVWAGTTREGAARMGPRPESWQTDRFRGGLRVFDDGTWHTLDIGNSGLLANDISDVAVADNGDVWVATEGWGIAVYRVGVEAPTPTPTIDAPTPTASPTPSPTLTPTVNLTPATATATRRPPSATPAPGWPVYLPFTQRPK